MYGPCMADILLRPQQVARRLAITVQTLTAWRHDGKGPRWIVLGGDGSPRYRYRPTDVEAWLEAQTRGSS